ncbi:MAG: DALR domain-containing protein, partial [Candidatus Bathyarchaeia archaeon]
LIFPHHENERAQTEAATGKGCANFWVHNGFVNIEKEKMSKSLGNIVLLKQFLKDYHPDVLRLLFLSTHYRSPIDYSEGSVQEAEVALSRLYYTSKRVSELLRVSCPEPKIDEGARGLEAAFFNALEDDMNTALAMSCLFELSKKLNRMIDEQDESNRPFVHGAYAIFTSCLQMLGLFRDDPDTFDRIQKERYLKRVGLTFERVEALLREREEARKRRDFEKADAIREALLAKGIVLMDKKEGTEWRVR